MYRSIVKKNAPIIPEAVFNRTRDLACGWGEPEADLSVCNWEDFTETDLNFTVKNKQV